MVDLIIDGLCTPEPPLNKEKQKQQKEPLRHQKDPAARSTRQAVRQEEDFDHFEQSPGIIAERHLPPAWDGRVKPKVLTAAPSIVDTLSRQLEKVINKAQAKLAKLQANVQQSSESIEQSKDFLQQRNDHFIEDSDVERQLVLKQLQHIESQNKHREKISFNPLNIMGLVTKILKKNDDEYHSQGAKDAIALEVNKLIDAGVWDIKPIARRDAMNFRRYLFKTRWHSWD